MALTDKLTAIADSIRSKTGKTDTLTLDTMPAEIEGIVTETIPNFPPEDIPEYIKVEAAEVASKVRAATADESIVFIAMSDNHHNAAQESSDTQNIEGNFHTGMAMKALVYMINPDFVAHMGDLSWGAKTTTPAMLKQQIETFNSYFAEAGSNIPRFVAIGNHDAGIYYHNAVNDGTVYTLPGDYLYENFTALSDSENTVFGGEEYGGYCYRDFPDKKLRVILLNTSEQLVSKQYDAGTLPSQQLWTANVLKDIGSKDDAGEWKFIVLCHYPLDYGENRPISNVFKAYVNGESISITVDGTSSTVDFNGYNAAKFIAQFHGHTHCFKYAKLNGYDSSGTMSEYDAWRVAIPNVQYNRENYYTSPMYGVYFNDDVTCTKTPDTAEETSFVVNVINPSEQVIHSFCYGAGYDRTIDFKGTVYYSIVKSLTSVSISNDITSIAEGEAYTATLTAEGEGYAITSITVTMGGTDVTSSVYSNGAINIASVTGNVVITAVATKVPTSNLAEIAEAIDSTEPYNGTGYKDGYYLSSSASPWEGVDSTTVVTGFIPYCPYKDASVGRGSGLPKTIYIKGAEWKEISHCRMYFFDEAKATLLYPMIAGAKSDSNALSYNFTVETLGDKYIKLTPVANTSSEHSNAAIGDWIALRAASASKNIAYFRMSLVGTGEDLIITFEDTE